MEIEEEQCVFRKDRKCTTDQTLVVRKLCTSRAWKVERVEDRVKNACKAK